MVFRQPSPFFYIICIVILYELEENIQFPSTIRLLENAICQRHYASLEQGDMPVNEARCKISAIQHQLASVRGWYSTFSTLPVLILSPILGNLADRYGRRIVLATAIFGMMTGMAWVYMICSFWKSFATELVWLIILFRTIGGGPFIVIALYVTMISDLCTSETRSQTLYKAFCFKLIIDLIAPQFASALLLHSLWLPYLICGVSLLLTFPFIKLMPETLHLNQNLPQLRLEGGNEHGLGIRAYRTFLGNKDIALGLAVVFLVQLRYNAIQLIPIYTSVKFGWKISKTAKLLSIVPGISLGIYLILPSLTDFLRDRRHIPVPVTNLYVARSSSVALLLGMALMSVTPGIGGLILALVVFACGFNIRAPMLAVMSEYMDTLNETAQLYTLVSMTDALAHMVGSPIFESVWGHAVKLGGPWLVLQFVILTLCFMLATLLTVLLPIYSGINLEGSGVDNREEEEPLVEDRED